MTFRVVLLTQAKDDIRRNANWWSENHSQEQAVDWFYSVYEQLKQLGESPFRFALAAERETAPYEIREMLLKPANAYRAVFTVVSQSVFVIAIRRAEQDRLYPQDFPRVE